MLDSDQKHNLYNERGAALLLTLILMLVLSLLTVSMFELLKASTQIAGNQRQDLQAIYLADSGAEDAINQLRNNPELAKNGLYTFPIPPDLVEFAGGTYTFTIEDISTPNPMFLYAKEIISTGTFRNITRVLKVRVRISDTPGDKGAIIYAVMTSYWKLL